MKELIPMDEYGLIACDDYIVRIDSRYVADLFDKKHKDVLRSIKNLLAPASGLSLEFKKNNYLRDEYIDVTGRHLPRYLLTRDGFSMLAMGYTGNRVRGTKEEYFDRFLALEKLILKTQAICDMHYQLTEAITKNREQATPDDYIKEVDMICELTLGMTAQEYRTTNKIPESKAIESYLPPTDSELLKCLQRMDIGLQYAIPDFQQRKNMLQFYAYKWRDEHSPKLIEMGKDNE